MKDQHQIVDELSKVAEIVAERYPQLGSFEESLMKALYIWYSCLCIDKVCRHRDIHGVSPQNIMEVHDRLIEEGESNPWVRKGFVSARFFRRSLDQQKLKDYSWIPKNSMYWVG